MRTRRGGFSLGEVLLVAAFLGIIAAVAVPHLTRAIDNAAAAAVVADARSINTAIQSYIGAGNPMPPSGNWGEAPPELDEYIAETMTFSRRDAEYRFVTQPLSGTAQLWVEYPVGSPLGDALQKFRQTGVVTWTPTRTTFFLVQ